MSKQLVTYNVQFAACAAIVLGGLVVPASAQNGGIPRVAPERHFTIPPDATTAVVLLSEPGAVCDLHPAGVNDPSQTMRLSGSIEGYVMFHFTPVQDAEDAYLQLDCSAADAVTTYPVHLRIAETPTADMPAPESFVPTPKGSRIRPGLTDEAARQLSDDEVIAGGYPPRPDASESPDEYAKWLDRVARPIAILPPHGVRRSDVHHSPGVQEGIAGAASSNWSGFVASGPSGSFRSVVGEWRVPYAKGEAGNQTYSSVWVGLDGNTSNDLIQAGTEQDTVFTILGTFTSYYAWSEVLPNQPTAVEQFSVSSSDLISVNVYVCDSAGLVNPNGGYACLGITDHTTGQAYADRYNLGTSYKFLGNSAEWITERPCIANCSSKTSRVLPELTHYGVVGMVGATYLPATGTAMLPYTKAATNRITMREANNPQPDNDVLSTVSSVAGHNDWMYFYWKNFH